MATPASALILRKFRGCSAEGGRETDRQTDRDRETDRDRQTDGDRQADRHDADRHDADRHRQTDRRRQAGRQTEAETRQRDLTKHSELCLPVDYILQAFWGNA